MAEIDNVVALTPWDAALRRATARRKAVRLVDRKDADAAIRALTEVEAYHVVKDVGLEDATAILAGLEPEQVGAILDIDLWHEQRFHPSDALVWFQAFREAGLEPLIRAARALDPEALAALFRRRLFITLKPKEDATDQDPLPDWAVEPPEEIEPLIDTDDGRFIIAARTTDDVDETAVEEEERKGILELVHQLYQEEDFSYVAGVLRTAMTDLGTDLEETALQFRNGRLEDLGFPPPSRALEIYGPLDPDRLTRPSEARFPILDFQLPVLYVEPLSKGLFHQAMEVIEDPAVVRRIEADLVPMANAALVADGAEPGQLDQLQDTLTRARGYIQLALGFDTTASERVQVAAQRLALHSVSALFRMGYTLTLRVGERARRLMGHAGVFEEVEEAALASLAARRPRYAAALDSFEEPEARLDETRIHDERPFDDIDEIAKAHAFLSDLEAWRAATDTLELRRFMSAEGAIEPPIEERTAARVLTTAGARVLVGGHFEGAALTADELAKLRAFMETDENQRLQDWSGPEQAMASCLPDALSRPAAIRRLRSGLSRVRESLMPGEARDRVDVRFVDFVTRRLD